MSNEMHSIQTTGSVVVKIGDKETNLTVDMRDSRWCELMKAATKITGGEIMLVLERSDEAVGLFGEIEFDPRPEPDQEDLASQLITLRVEFEGGGEGEATAYFFEDRVERLIEMAVSCAYIAQQVEVEQNATNARTIGQLKYGRPYVHEEAPTKPKRRIATPSKVIQVLQPDEPEPEPEEPADELPYEPTEDEPAPEPAPEPERRAEVIKPLGPEPAPEPEPELSEPPIQPAMPSVLTVAPPVRGADIADAPPAPAARTRAELRRQLAERRTDDDASPYGDRPQRAAPIVRGDDTGAFVAKILQPIAVLELDPIPRRDLERHELTHLHMICSKTEEELLELGLTQENINKVKVKLQHMNLSLGMDISPGLLRQPRRAK